MLEGKLCIFGLIKVEKGKRGWESKCEKERKKSEREIMTSSDLIQDTKGKSPKENIM